MILEIRAGGKSVDNPLGSRCNRRYRQRHVIDVIQSLFFFGQPREPLKSRAVDFHGRLTNSGNMTPILYPLSSFQNGLAVSSLSHVCLTRPWYGDGQRAILDPESRWVITTQGLWTAASRFGLSEI